MKLSMKYTGTDSGTAATSSVNQKPARISQHWFPGEDAPVHVLCIPHQQGCSWKVVSSTAVPDPTPLSPWPWGLVAGARSSAAGCVNLLESFASGDIWK